MCVTWLLEDFMGSLYLECADLAWLALKSCHVSQPRFWNCELYEAPASRACSKWKHFPSLKTS
jgi:hypothetical protein